MKHILLFFLITLPFFAYGNSYKLTTITDGLDHPWSIEFLPDNQMLVSERPGKLRYIDMNGKKSEPIKGLPKIHAEAQGGLLDILIDPDFLNNKMIYLSYAEASNGKSGTAVLSAKLNGMRLEDVKVIFRQIPKTDNSAHYGSRLVMADDGTLFITLGEKFKNMDQAQDLDNHFGKVVRINKDGTVPKDNPFVNNKDAMPEIWSYGHRNPQGAALNPIGRKLWIHEHGPKGGDEINIPQAGKNYGWPEASYGIHYWLLPIEDDHKGQGFEEPVYYWTPSIAPSGMMFYTGDKFPKWQGNLFIGALAEQHLVRLELDGDNVVKQEKLLTELKERIRDVTQGLDGYIYVITDSGNGKVIRVGE